MLWATATRWGQLAAPLRNSEATRLTIAVEGESLVDLHVAALEGAVGGSAELLLDFGLVEVGLDPLHLRVAEGSTADGSWVSALNAAAAALFGRTHSLPSRSHLRRTS